ncbi:MAG: transglycosylase domain-containing protein, partial [Bryobacteraceae bacterium]
MSVGDWVISGTWKTLGAKSAADDSQESPPQSKQLRRAWWIGILAGVLAIAVLADLNTSWMQARVLSAVARRMTYSLARGPSSAISYPKASPYDLRMGYAQMPAFLPRLNKAGFQIVAQARDSRLFRFLARIGIYPVWREKSQAGLQILDQNRNSIFASPYPARLYARFSDIPPLVVNSLLFIENRHILDARYPYRNPAVDWDRFGLAVFDLGIHAVDRSHPIIGGSTLATQLEKMRHSPDGRTGSVRDKFRQMASASLAAYQSGPRTLAAQERIVRDYINSIPLAASGAQGEVTGLGDGLRYWYGADFATVNRLLQDDETTLDSREQAARARAYRQVLSLFLALRQPSRYLVSDPAALTGQTDRYLRALCGKGVISPRLRDMALAANSDLMAAASSRVPVDYVARKGVNAVRASLLATLGLRSVYDLDRLDLTVDTTLDNGAQAAAARFLRQALDPAEARKAGLVGHDLLDSGNPARVIYSVTLYERVHGANLLRVQTDNYDHPLNINQGTRLELGSTAKLRTLINYLEIVAALRQQYVDETPSALASIAIYPGDNLTA